jgi:hypothetical protein
MAFGSSRCGDGISCVMHVFALGLALDQSLIGL